MAAGKRARLPEVQAVQGSDGQSEMGIERVHAKGDVCFQA
jgi:hypothetical protein